jgi:uncharacterized protein (UPF0332 family)
MDPKHFLDLARQLSARDDAPACRTAISRAYYAAYHVAAGMLKNRIGVRIPSGVGGHGAVQDCLALCEDPDVKRVGHRIATLYSDRVRADYRLDRRDVETARNARLRVDAAQVIIGILGKCLGDNARLEAMRDVLSKAEATKRLLS